MEHIFTWDLDDFSAFDNKTHYSPHFAVAGCNWYLCAYPNEDTIDEYLSVYLELAPGSSPPVWRRFVRFSLTLENKYCPKSNKVLGGQCYFEANDNSWGFSKFLPLYKLQDRREGFLDDNNRLTFVAYVHVLPLITPLRLADLAKITTSPSCKEGDQASYASVVKSQGPSYCQAAQESENVNDDVDASEEGTDDEVMVHLIKKILEEVFSYEIDRAPREDVDDEASSLVTSDKARNGGSVDQVKSLEDDAPQTVENGDMGFNTVASVTETSKNVLEESQPVKETMDVNGFEVCSSQVESVRHIFKRHPDIAVEFRAKNQHLKNACMNFLLSLIKTLCQSLEELSVEDLVEADIALTYLKDAGFKVDWLEKKLDQLKDNKEKERSGLARLQEIEEDLLKLKQKCSDLDALAEKEKSELSATRTALSFDDLV